MSSSLARILYAICAIAWCMLLWRNPITIFMAACFSCLTLPFYRRLERRAAAWRQRLKTENRRGAGFLDKLCAAMPVTGYVGMLLAVLLLPVVALVSLVSPQAVAGLAVLRELQESNFRLPPDWVERIQDARRILAEYPDLEKFVNDVIANLNNFFSESMGMIVSRSFSFLGSTVSAGWVAFLFLTLTILFTLHSRRIRLIAQRILRIPDDMLGRFLLAIHNALKAIMLGIVLVALAQGALCGIGFYVAGLSQPAFWGMLATMVAPIPAVGTAIVWLPLCVSLWFGGKTMAAICLALWGVIFVAGIDNVLRPFFLRQGIKASFFTLILTILCGLSAFGAVGLIAGPILLAVAIQAYEEANGLYRLEP